MSRLFGLSAQTKSDFVCGKLRPVKEIDWYNGPQSRHN